MKTATLTLKVKLTPPDRKLTKQITDELHKAMEHMGNALRLALQHQGSLTSAKGGPPPKVDHA
jgi:hypothetical protein